MRPDCRRTEDRHAYAGPCSPPGRRNRPTIEDVAELAGVSRGTVSRVLNGGRHVRPALMTSVNSAIEALGYSVNQAARNLAAGRTGSVAFVISEQARSASSRTRTSACSSRFLPGSCASKAVTYLSRRRGTTRKRPSWVTT